ncbi:hypothetical protein [Nocardioides sp. AE5]|uniref:hypothetical protein n=1 Tax=Nocardioides sp. AE5 TaxID=2962573 RepID=UPI002881E217|nr:hypothetical protein [Nocardioides sp. AE5]MDT0202157.1 hypothetical protein [Nocardioides sp. AE5]
MAGEGKGFRVDPEKLHEVATMAQDLADDIREGHGASTNGRYEDFTRDAGPHNLQAAYSSMWPDSNIGDSPAKAYTYVYDAMDAKYNAMASSLEWLAQAAEATATQYENSEDANRQTATSNETSGGI